jgi:hypothetical protein
MDQVALVEVLASTQRGTTHAAAVKDVREAALDHLATLAHSSASNRGFETRPIGVDRFLGGLVAMPAQDAFGRLGSDMRLLQMSLSTRLRTSREWYPSRLRSRQALSVTPSQRSLNVGARPMPARFSRYCLQRRVERVRVALVGRVDRRQRSRLCRDRPHARACRPPHAFSADHFWQRVSSVCAAS